MTARSGVRRGVALWLGSSLVGLAVVAVPDREPRVITLSEGHGPSAVDLLGVALLLIGWACLLVSLLRSRALIPHPGLLLGAVLAGQAVVAWSVDRDVGTWWILGALVAAGSQLFAALAVASKGSEPHVVAPRRR